MFILVKEVDGHKGICNFTIYLFIKFALASALQQTKLERVTKIWSNLNQENLQNCL